MNTRSAELDPHEALRSRLQLFSGEGAMAKCIIPPLPVDPVAERFRAADLEMIHAVQCVQGARNLGAARNFVGALIDGKITERELIEAGRDPVADKALLVRVTSKGLDASGDPLFSDVDAHLALVADAGGA